MMRRSNSLEDLLREADILCKPQPAQAVKVRLTFLASSETRKFYFVLASRRALKPV